MNYEQLAKRRVAENPELSQHEDIIFYDWSNWDEHMEWIATAPVEQITSWARTIKSYSQENAASAMGKKKSPSKTKAARENAKKGGWEKGRKRGPRKPKGNDAH